MRLRQCQQTTPVGFGLTQSVHESRPQCVSISHFENTVETCGPHGDSPIPSPEPEIGPLHHSCGWQAFSVFAGPGHGESGVDGLLDQPVQLLLRGDVRHDFAPGTALAGLAHNRIGHKLEVPALALLECSEEPCVLRGLRRPCRPARLFNQAGGIRPLRSHDIENMLVTPVIDAPQHPGILLFDVRRKSGPHRRVHGLRIGEQLPRLPTLRVDQNPGECRRHAEITASKNGSSARPSGLSTATGSSWMTSRQE
ncbi:hypothetical protein COFR110785_04840 [Corynebacterium frankenforstense]